ncbi:MAG TPA: hypothetical protein DCR12_06075 [Lachnospiraceae bacterium]|nr:hypothetical protein [Lachnospiraceae bacterium]
MDYRFKRDLKNSFMIVESGFENAGYEKDVLRFNDIDVLVPFHTVDINNVTQVWYDITGLVSLKDYLMQQSITYELMRKVFLYLKIAIDETERYLIDINHLSINVDTVFVVKNDVEWKVMLIYYPDENQSSLESILEFFMSNVSKDMMDFCFKLYDSGMDGNTIDGIIRLIDDEIGCDDIVGDEANNKNEQHDSEEYDYRNEDEERRLDWEYEGSRISDDEDYIWGNNKIDIFGEEELTIFDKIKKCMTDFFETKKKNILDKADNKISLFSRKENRKNKNDIMYEDFSYEPDQQIYEPTVLLKAIEEDRDVLNLKYIGNSKKDDIRIDKEEFRVGSSIEGNDSVIDSPVISRFHAKIIKEGKSYYVEDLNSTNGTSVNGKLLGYRDRIELNPEDTIMFADECYKIV